jgi:hypothetical protein
MGKAPDDQTLMIVVEKVKEIYQNGRKASLKEEEFKKLLRTLQLIQE